MWFLINLLNKNRLLTLFSIILCKPWCPVVEHEELKACGGRNHLVLFEIVMNLLLKDSGWPENRTTSIGTNASRKFRCWFGFLHLTAECLDSNSGFFLQIPVSCSYSPLSDCSSNFIITTHIEDLDCVSNSRLGPSPGLASEHLGCELVDSISGYLSVFLSLHLSASQII